jgi:excisionase family DNA binding protein
MAIARFATQELEDILADESELLEVWEVAQLTNSHERTVRRWLANGRLAGLQKSTRGYLIPKRSLINFLTGGSTVTDEEGTEPV